MIGNRVTESWYWHPDKKCDLLSSYWEPVTSVGNTGGSSKMEFQLFSFLVLKEQILKSMGLIKGYNVISLTHWLLWTFAYPF